MFSILLVLKILFWIAIILIGWFIFVETVGRVIRRFIHFPIPSFLVPLLDNPIRRRIQPPAKVIDWIDIKDGMQVLEIGPGVGTFTIEASRRVGEKGRVYAIDIQSNVVLKLKRRLRREGITNAEAIVGSAYELPLRDKSIDRAFMIAVLGEIPDKRKALLEIKRVLKDGGLLAIGELLIDPDYPRKKTTIGWCREAGFELIGSYGNILHYLLTFKKSMSGSTI